MDAAERGPEERDTGKKKEKEEKQTNKRIEEKQRLEPLKTEQ